MVRRCRSSSTWGESPGMTKEGKAILCGDVDFETVKEKASAINPGARGSGADDHYHVDDEHGEGGKVAPN